MGTWLVDTPLAHAGIWLSFDDRRPEGWRVVPPISGEQSRFLARQAVRGWWIGWARDDLGKSE